MKPRMLFLYFLFFIAVFIVFLFVLFPRKKVSSYLSQSMENLNSHIRVSFDSVQPVFPFKLDLENTKIGIDNILEIKPEIFELSAGPSFIFNSNKKIKFRSDLYQGYLKGSLSLNNMVPPVVSLSELFLSGLKINDFRYHADIADITLGCELSGEYISDPLNNTKSGRGKIFIKKFEAKLKNSLLNTLNIPLIDFSDIKLEFTQAGQKIMVSKCIARGSIIHVKLKGTLEVLAPLPKSKLMFTGVVLPESPYLAKFANTTAIRSAVRNISTQGIHFKLNGTLNHPKIGI